MMKKILFIGLSVATFSLTASANVTNELKTEKQKLSYAIGLKLGEAFRVTPTFIDSDYVAIGLKDSINNIKPQISAAEITKVLKDYDEDRRKIISLKVVEISKKNLKEGEKFLKDNKTKPGVVTLPDGLQYKVLKKGTGTKTPFPNDNVTVNYEGYKIDRTVIDSSYIRNKPASFKLSSVIPGWSEALQLMHVGDKFKIFLPSKLAYGKRGAGKMIEPNSVLIFEIELLKINKNTKNINTNK